MSMSNKTSLRAAFVVVSSLVGAYWLLCHHSAQIALADTSKPSTVERLHPFSLSNAPGAVGGIWQSNQPFEPVKEKLMQQVAVRVRASLSNGVVGSAAGPVRTFRDDIQSAAFRRLKQRVGASLEVYLRDGSGTAIQIKGNPLFTPSNSDPARQSKEESVARSFLRENAALLLLDNADEELKLTTRQTDGLGGVHIRFSQSYNGLEVWPAELAVHLDSDGNIKMVDGAYIATPEGVEVQPTLSAVDAGARARNAVTGGQVGNLTVHGLVIYAGVDQKPRLAWKLNVAVSLDQVWWVVIDALDGRALATISRVTTGRVAGSGTDLLGLTRPLSVWQSGTTFYMIDASKGMFNSTTGEGTIETDDVRGLTQSQIEVANTLQNINYVTSASSNSWNNSDAVSAAYNLSQTYDYYSERFGRNSYDGNGGNVVALVRIGSLANAFWQPQHKMMFFGNVDRYAGSLDVIGHEMTHGVIDSIGSQGVLMYTGQSGALNEALADIFGEMVEGRTKGTNDWLIGSQLATALRNMGQPASYGQPGKMSEYNVTKSDNGGVHFNSGIINRAYYLLAVGLKGCVGTRDAERIFYRCLTVSMMPFSQFVDFRLGCVAAAEDLFGAGSPQALKTAEAFDAVELYASPASVPESPNVDAVVQAAESKLFIRRNGIYRRDDLFRYESSQGDPSSGWNIVTSVQVTRPSVLGNGSEMFFVGADDSLCVMGTDGTGFTTQAAGTVHSVAVSPEGRYVAFVFNSAVGIPTNQIVLLDVLSNVTTIVKLVTPVADGAPLHNISYADALSFSPDGKMLIYDAVSRLRRADGQLREAWSIFGMDMATLQQRVIVPPDEHFNLGNPAFSRTSGRFVAFDAIDSTGNSTIVTLDLYQGTVGGVGLSYNGLGYPFFGGDGNSVFYADKDPSTTTGRSIIKQALSADRLSMVGSRVLAVTDAKLSVGYRRGKYPSVNTTPFVTLTNPMPNAVYTAPALVTIGALASDLNGTVSRVEFYSGGSLLATDTTPPYSFTWTNLAAGVYSVYARAYDDQEASSTTALVRFTVKSAAQPGVLNRPGAPGFELSLRLKQSGLYRLETSTNLVQWSSLGSFYCSTNLGFLDSGATNYQRRFYRALATP